MQTREATGFGTAEAGWQLFPRVVNITPASTNANATSAEQTFAIVNVLALDTILQITNTSQAQTAGVLMTPARITSAGSATINIAGITTQGTTPIAGNYTFVIMRRGTIGV